MSKKKKNKNFLKDLINVAKAKQREEEISLHSKPINHSRVSRNKKKYSRKNYKIKVGE
ncbi:MAG: hypothetical protein PHE13_07870 [Bacteroidales bacterium]|nr:hypothetical protein [Bacteroidales bacterium]